MSRRSQSESDDTPPPPQQFMFIDSTADRATANEAIRVHAMRHSHRTRRGPNDQSRRTQTHGEMTFLTSTIPMTRSDSALSRSQVPVQQTRRPSATQQSPRQSATVDWHQALRSGLSDVSYRAVTDLEALADACKLSMSHCFAKGARNLSILIPDVDLENVRLLRSDVLRLCRGDELALNAFLALAAFQHSPGMLESINVASAQFEAGALERLRLRISSSSSRQSDATLLAVLLLSRVEDLKGSQATAAHHRNALRTFIQDRGGLRVLGVESPALYRVLEDCGINE